MLSSRSAFRGPIAVVFVVLVCMLVVATAAAAPRAILGRWPEPVGDERLAQLEAAASADGADATNLNDLARAYGSRAQWRQCLDAAERAVAKDPKLVTAHVSVAGAYLNSERPKQAVAAARKAVAIGPGDPSGYYILGWANHKLSRPEEAVAALETCVRLDPKDPWAQYSLAVAYSGAQNFRLTKKYLQSTLELEPPEKLASMAKIMLEQVEAVSNVVMGSYQQAVEKNPDVAVARVMLAAAYLQFGYEAEAVVEADVAIEQLRAVEADGQMQPKQRDELADALRVRGVALVRLKRWADAAAALESSAELVPPDARVLYNLGLVRLRQESSAEAVMLLEKAVTLAPAERPARLALIDAYEAAGQAEQAERERERLEEL